MGAPYKTFKMKRLGNLFLIMGAISATGAVYNMSAQPFGYHEELLFGSIITTISLLIAGSVFRALSNERSSSEPVR